MNDKSAVVKAETSTRKAVWKTYGVWAFWVGVAFFTVYPLCNWWTSQRAEVYRFYMDAELAIPLVPEFIWIYMSLYLLFLLPPFFLGVSQLVLLGKRLIAATLMSGVLFLLFPSRLGFERMVPEGDYAAMFGNIFAVDLPHNMAPSLHVVYSAFILIAVAQSSAKKSVQVAAYGWLGLVALSTLLVHQHHLIDIASAMLLTLLVGSKLIKGERNG